MLKYMRPRYNLYVLLKRLDAFVIYDCYFTVLQKAGRHMEHTLIGAYVVLLLGYLIMDNKVKIKRHYMKII